MIRVIAVHTALALVEPLNELFRELLPQVKLNHIADDSLIQEVIANNTVTQAVKNRLNHYYQGAEEAQATLIFNTCSSIGEVAEKARDILQIPLIKIDDAMAEKAVSLASKIGVIATLPTTLQPTVKLLKKMAAKAGKNIEVVEGLAKGAFEAVMSGDKETHDRLILEASEKVAPFVDVIVLAQGSMARMEKSLAERSGKTVLSSPRLGVLSIKEYLEKNNLI